MILTIGDLGERKILQDIIPLYTSHSGDDCAILSGLDEFAVVTTDPVPQPAALSIGGDPDLYWLGWLLVTINASDIAASGARPIAFVAALDLPETLSVFDFERLLAGIRDSCAANSLKYVGGNLRESNAVSAVGTAFGSSVRRPLQRNGAKADDFLVVIGEGGRFWADVERIRLGYTLNKAFSPIFSPVSQAKHMQALHEQGLLNCAMDTSDGLAPTLVELARINNLGISVDIGNLTGDRFDEVERTERFWMGWGDWTVAVAVNPKNLAAIEATLAYTGGKCTRIGRFTQDNPCVTLRSGHLTIPLERLESERFASDSWFKLGIEEYRRRLHSISFP